MLSFEEVEDCFPEGACSDDATGKTLVSAQWLHDFARAVEEKAAMERDSRNPAAGWPMPVRKAQDTPTQEGLGALRTECLRLRLALEDVALRSATKKAMKDRAREALYGGRSNVKVTGAAPHAGAAGGGNPERSSGRSG